MNLSLKRVLSAFAVALIVAAVMYIFGLLIFPAFAITGLTPQQFASIFSGVIGLLFGLFLIEELVEERDKLNIEKDNKQEKKSLFKIFIILLLKLVNYKKRHRSLYKKEKLKKKTKYR